MRSDTFSIVHVALLVCACNCSLICKSSRFLESVARHKLLGQSQVPEEVYIVVHNMLRLVKFGPIFAGLSMYKCSIFDNIYHSHIHWFGTHQ